MTSLFHPMAHTRSFEHVPSKRDLNDVVNKINGVANDITQVGGAIDNVANSIVGAAVPIMTTFLSVPMKMSAGMFSSTLTAFTPALNQTINALGPITNMMGGLIPGMGGGGNKGGNSAAPPPKPKPTGSPATAAPPAVYPMCQLSASSSQGAFPAAQIAKWKLQWQYGMTYLALNSARASICKMTSPLSAAEVQFFTQTLTNPQIITPDEEAFTAQEEAQFQYDLPREDMDKCQAFVHQISPTGAIPSITSREINLIVAACSQVSPVTILPTNTNVCVVVVDQNDNTVCVPYGSFQAISDPNAGITGQQPQAAPADKSQQASGSKNQSQGANSQQQQPASYTAQFEPDSKSSPRYGSSQAENSGGDGSANDSAWGDDSSDDSEAPTITTDTCKGSSGNGTTMQAKYQSLLDTLENGGSIYYLQLQLNAVCASKVLSKKQVKAVVTATADATITTPPKGALLMPAEKKALLKQFNSWTPKKQAAFVSDITDQGVTDSEIAAFNSEIKPTITAATCKGSSKGTLTDAQVQAFMAILTEGGSKFYLQMLVDSLCASGSLTVKQASTVKSTALVAKITTPPNKNLMMPVEQAQLLSQFST
ncbi:hypothetical protein FRB95_005865 [Tulasnella sp. JGI-2019a]|nr:hypothetical protein FRB95_005865 [Tulasnella sp. JGI-2019a]